MYFQTILKYICFEIYPDRITYRKIEYLTVELTMCKNLSMSHEAHLGP